MKKRSAWHGSKRVAPSLAFENDFAVLTDHSHRELGHRLGRMETQHLHGRRNGISNVDRGGKPPVLAQKDGAGARNVHRHQRVQEAGRQPALHDQPTKPGLPRERLIEMKRIVIPGQRRV